MRSTPMRSVPNRRTVLALALALGSGAVCAGCGSRKAPASSHSGASDSGNTASGGASDEGNSASRTPQPSASPTASPAVASLAASLSPREAAAQHVFTAVPQGSSPWKKELVGGYFLLSQWRSRGELTDALSAIRAHNSSVAPLISVDQEGGQVRMLRTNGFPVTPSAENLGSRGPTAVRKAYVELGNALKELGIHLSLAPVADAVDPTLGNTNAPVGKLNRGFGTDPTHVASCVKEAVKGLTQGGTAATLKHFPGLGRVRENTDHSAEGITDDATHSTDPFLAPFTAGIEAGAQVVMLSSATYTAIDDRNPAMFSRTIVTDLLRGSLGFDRVVMTDDVGAAQAVQNIPVTDRVTRFLDAGGDIAITADPSLTSRMIDAAERWARKYPKEARASLLRILTLKEERGLL